MNSGALRPGISAGQVFAYVAGFVALAAVGATLGWTLTKVPDGSSANPPASSPPASISSTPSLSPSPSLPSVSPSSPATSPTGYLIPDFAALGTDFKDARQQLIDQKMAVVLVFDDASTATPGTVERTQPPAGSPGRKGLTVKMFVNGAPPPLDIPAPQPGANCEAYAKALVLTGFTIEYQGNATQAKRNFPADSVPKWTTTSVWNTKIRLICTPDGTLPTSPSPSDIGSPSPTDTQTPP